MSNLTISPLELYALDADARYWARYEADKLSRALAVLSSRPTGAGDSPGPGPDLDEDEIERARR